jgi:hypothetical protein
MKKGSIPPQLKKFVMAKKKKSQNEKEKSVMAGPGLYANIAAKKARIKAGSGEKMRKKGSKGSPTKANFARAAQTARKR